MPRRLILVISFCCFFKIASTQEAKLMLQIGHVGAVRSAHFSPDGKKIVTTSEDNTAKIWDATTGVLLTNLNGHHDEINSAEFSPACPDDPKGGKKIVTASWDSTAKIWNASTGTLLVNLKGHTDEVIYAQFSPDGKKILTASRDKTAKIWDAATGLLLKNLKAHSGKITAAQFSPDGKKILTASSDNTAKIWDASSGLLLRNLKSHSWWVSAAAFSPDGKKIVTSSWDSTAKIWDAGSGLLLKELSTHSNSLTSAQFSPDGKKIVTSSWDSTAKIWDVATGDLLKDLKTHDGDLFMAQFSPNGETIITASGQTTAKIWDAIQGTLLVDLKGYTNGISTAGFSPDGKKIITASFDGTSKIWSTGPEGLLLADLKGYTESVWSARFSPDGKKMVTATDKFAKIWDAGSGAFLYNLKGHKSRIFYAEFSPACINDPKGGEKIVTASNDSTAKVWEAVSGKLLCDLKGHKGGVISAQFSPDGKKIITASFDSTAKIWDAGSGTILKQLTGHTGMVFSAQFSSDGLKILTSSTDGTARIWDGISGMVLKELKAPTRSFYYAQFSPDGQKILTVSDDNKARIWDAVSGVQLRELTGHTGNLISAQFSPDGKKIVTTANDNTAIIWDLSSGRKLAVLKGHSNIVITAQFSPACAEDPIGGKRIVTASVDNTAKVWDAVTGNLLYSFFSVDNNDYLITDPKAHYDGTEAARKLLYFTCGSEVIGLDQVKDQLWVPNLAERISKGDTINARSLEELNICGYTPEVEDITDNVNEYHFKILPRRGGLGQTALYLNGIELFKYKPEELQKGADGYHLHVPKEKISSFLIPQKENKVTVRSWTADNTLTSRGVIITEVSKAASLAAPNLYAVLVGVSDYKGEKMDLTYAAKDATDISNVLSLVSKKLLNSDSQNHVFTYDLTTAKDHYLLPEKKSIRSVFEEIGKKANSNDILFIFFAGHGVMAKEGDQKQFYFLTADASIGSSIDAIKEVGISTTELAEWTKPLNIKAQKRVLIFDACNSGQIINDFVQLGKPGQGYMPARNDERGQQIKAIEKLNNQSGLIILAASASDRDAYEMGRYSQGLLTYSLLKVLKQQPEILENGKYLDVNNWLNAAKKMVSALAETAGTRQEPQFNFNNNFNIGEVDEEVRNKINLTDEKPIFSRSNFQNAATKLDNLKIRSAIDKELLNISSSGGNAEISYSADYEGEDVYSLTGDYKITGDSISVSVILTKGGTETLKNYEAKGSITNLKELVQSIIAPAVEWFKNNK